MSATALEHLLPIDPDNAPREGAAGPDHPMRRVTREAAFKGGWSKERAAKVGQLFDGLAVEWHTRGGPERDRVVADALARGRVGEMACLEVGSGTGFGTSILSGHFEQVIALDIAPEMLRRAPPELAPRVLADASALPFADASVPAVALVNALLFPHEIARVLAPGGAVIWVNTSGTGTPIHLCAEDFLAALPGPWTGIASQIGRGTWCVARRAR